VSLFSILHHSSRALQTAGTGVSVASNNVANANTQGYARQSLAIGTQGTIRAEGLLLGQGVTAESVISHYDRFSQGNVFGRMATSGYHGARAQSFRAIETRFTETDAGSLSESINELFDSFSALETDPNSNGFRLGVLGAGTSLVEMFNQTAEALGDQRTSLDQQIVGSVGTLNTLGNQIGGLNARIVQLEAGGGQAHDLRAQRTAILEQMSDLAPVRAIQEGDGSMRVLVAGHTVVEGGTVRALSAVADPATGLHGVHIAQGSGTFDITASMTGGTLGGMLAQRDTTVAGLIDDLDELAFTLANTVNAQHAAGYDLDGNTGQDFFTAPTAQAGAALALSMDAAMIGNPDGIAAAQDPAALPGDNTNATALAALAETASMASGQNFQAFYGSILGALGQDASLAYGNETRAAMDVQGALDLRDSVSGVNLEEEALDLLRFQDAYQAAARVFATTNEMLDELMQLV
jgi:flagellar hook-associated protein 1 FlgK